MAMAAPMQMFSLSRRERNSNINVGSFDPTRKHSDRARWICIYPAYLNKNKSRLEGRRVASEKAVENPTINEIRDVLVNAGLPVEVEPNKVYPREQNKYENLSRGRIRVQIKNEDSSFLKPNFKTRDSVLLYLAETIPKLKSRGSGSGAQASGSGNQGAGKKSKQK